MPQDQVINTLEGIPSQIIFGDACVAEYIKHEYGMNSDGIPIYKIVLIPDDDCKQQHNIKEEDLVRGFFKGVYKQHDVIINPPGPRMRYVFILSDIFGGETELTKLYKKYRETIEELYIKVQSLKLAHIADERRIRLMGVNPLGFMKIMSKLQMEKNKGMLTVERDKESDFEN